MYSVNNLPTPCYVINKKALEHNMKICKYIEDSTDAKILLAQKAFSPYYLYHNMRECLAGTSASSLFEARLGYEEMHGKEVHIYSPAYKEDEMTELLEICDYITFNSPTQWSQFRGHLKSSTRKVECGIRINPEYAEIEKDIYNPCAPRSRLGITLQQLNMYKSDFFGNTDGYNISGMLFHVLCEQNVDTLERVLKVIEKRFENYLQKIKWINMGGGHYITSEKYKVTDLINLLNDFRKKYNVRIYLEPGEAIGLHCGYLTCTVLDIIYNDMKIAIVDTSATCHIPNLLEVPFTPTIRNAAGLNRKKYNYRIAGISCLAGDIIGDYSFDHKLEIGERLLIEDMVVYSIVKNNTFNGIRLPSIAIEGENGIEIVKKFDYLDYKRRL